MVKYFHKLSAEEFKKVVDSKITYNELAIQYPQPEWCNYPDATSGLMGCWSLTSHMVTGREFCNKCECSKDCLTEE